MKPRRPLVKSPLERRVKRLIREIEEIESTFYTAHDGDPSNTYFLVSLRRKNAIRGIVLELHLAIEDLLTAWLTRRRSQGRQSLLGRPRVADAAGRLRVFRIYCDIGS